MRAGRTYIVMTKSQEGIANFLLQFLNISKRLNHDR
jgi:hypothetical protein